MKPLCKNQNNHTKRTNQRNTEMFAQVTIIDTYYIKTNLIQLITRPSWF